MSGDISTQSPNLDKIILRNVVIHVAVFLPFFKKVLLLFAL